VWQFLLGVIVGVAFGVVLMGALIASSRKPGEPPNDPGQ
jgi:hypothetical protein